MKSADLIQFLMNPSDLANQNHLETIITHIHVSDNAVSQTPTAVRKMLGALSPALSLNPHLTGLQLRGKPIFCYYFSCVWCKIAHYISRTELLALANWKRKVITQWMYTASSFVWVENWSNKAKIMQERCSGFNGRGSRKWSDTDHMRCSSCLLKCSSGKNNKAFKQRLNVTVGVKVMRAKSQSGRKVMVSRLRWNQILFGDLQLLVLGEQKVLEKTLICFRKKVN